MKLHEVAVMGSVLAGLVLKLVAKGEPVFVNAKGRTFLSGNDTLGFTASRSHHEGWINQRKSVVETSSVDAVRRLLGDASLHISNDKAYAMGADTGTYSGSLFQFERPIDEHYTLKQVDGVWTILDKAPAKQVDESQEAVEDVAVKLAYKKIRAAVGGRYDVTYHERVKPTMGGMTRSPYIRTEVVTGMISVHTYYDPETKDGKYRETPWFSAWFVNGRRSDSIRHFKTIDEVIDDLVNKT